MRIIAGKNKGKKLTEFDYDNIRPTSDIVKEAIFNSIQQHVAGSVFLDLFGGTGSIGIEAYSRGAEKVYITDNNQNSIRVIKKNISLIKAEDIEVLVGDYQKNLKLLKDKEIKFDIIFIDPPYDTDLGLKAIDKIYEYGLLQEDGFIVFETHKSIKHNFAHNVRIFNEKTYGIKRVSYIDFEVENND